MKTLVSRFAQRSSLVGIGLYLLTLLVELLGVWPRYLIIKTLFWPISTATTGIALFRNSQLLPEQQIIAPATGPGFSFLVLINSIAEPFARFFAWYPIVFGLATLLFLPGGFLLTRFALGARKPSTRERALIDAVLTDIMQIGRDARGPSGVYIIDNLLPNAYTIGTTLYLHSGLLSEKLPSAYRYGVIAHHLGHRNSFDGRLELALRRLVIYPVQFLARLLGTVAPGSFFKSIGRGDGRGCIAGFLIMCGLFVLALAGGGLGALILNPLWVAYRQRREYAADEYAKQLGQAGSLIQYLQRYTLNDSATPYHLNSSPANELRIDRLLNGPTVPNTMPLPFGEAAVLLGSLACVGLLTFCSFGGASALGFGPHLEGSVWYLESYAYENGSTVLDENCQLYFDAASIVEATCFSDGYAYQRKAHYTRVDHDSLLIDPLPNTMNLPFPFAGMYTYSFTGKQLVMVSDYGPTLRWIPPEEAVSLASMIVGTWEMTNPQPGGNVFTFNANGSWWADAVDAGGTYTFNGNQLTLNRDGYPSIEYTIHFNDNLLFLTSVGSVDEHEYRRVE